MKVCITGAAGFIGGNFVDYWMRQHPEDAIVAFDKLTYAGSLSRLKKARQSEKVSFVKGDICDYASVAKALKGCDYVVHFAAETHVDRSLSSLSSEKLFYDTNLFGTSTLLHAAKEAGVKRFHHVSTDEVFGELAFSGKDLFTERTPYAPKNPYSVSKAAADFTVKNFHRTYTFPITLSNCTNNYGPFQTPEKVIPRSIALLIAGKNIELYTDEKGVPGKNIRDWLYVEDHCSAIDAIVHQGKDGEEYCISGNNEMANIDLIKALLKEMSEQTGTTYTYEKNVTLVKDRPGHDLRYGMSHDKIARELGWRPAHSFSEGFKKTVAWYLSEEGRQWFAECMHTTHEVRKGQSAAHT